jgi:hypothetical protein
VLRTLLVLAIETCFHASVPAVVTTDGRRRGQIFTIFLENATQQSEFRAP